MRCNACRSEFDPAHVQNDHRVPRSIGGGNESANKQLLCIKCHQRKSGLEIGLFQFYAESDQLYEWLQLAFQGDLESIERWIGELQLKVNHFREVMRSMKGEEG